MKFLVVLVLLIACASASSLPKDILEKLVPSLSTNYIIKGENAPPHAAPYIVSLGSISKGSHSHFCGGVLIDKEWIVTAAHCALAPLGTSIIAGLHERLNSKAEHTQNRTVDFGRTHKLYAGGVAPHDIAVLHVDRPFEFNTWVKPAALPKQEEIYDGQVVMYGWGQPKAYILTGSKILKTVTTEIIEWNECLAILPEGSSLHKNNVCTSSMSQGISACNGDSGGPVVKERENGLAELVGVASWVYLPCGLANLPSAYTRVSAYVDWITNVKAAYYILH